MSGSKEEALRAELEQKKGALPFRILDLGCGPGTNATLFQDRNRYSYLGIDFNEAYIRQASDRYDLSFRVGDIADLRSPSDMYDIVLINSVFHHLAEDQANAVLREVPGRLAAGGECLVMDMVYPTRRRFFNFLARCLIRLDRGLHCRTECQLRLLLENAFDIVEPRAFHIKMAGIVLWEMWLYVCR